MNAQSCTIAGLLMTLVACAASEDPNLVGASIQGLGTFSEVTSFGSNPGALKAYAYVPDEMPANAPMVLALHACSQSAASYKNAGWNALADRLKFYVLYPEQQSRNNGLNCFNWAGEYGDPTNLRRGEGENQSIIQMIEKMKADHSIDAARVYIMGHSGGAAQTALMIATWPEVFSGAAMIAGVPYNCTTTFSQVSTCLTPGINRTAQEWGDRVRAGHPGYSGPRPVVSIWHGSSDTTVTPANMTELLEQWSNAAGIDTIADATDTVDGAVRRRYQDAGGLTRVETIEIPNMGHGTPVDPQSNCGATGPFFLDANICAVSRLAEFFGLAGSATPPLDTEAPTVSFAAPRSGETVNGLVPVQITARDNVGVTRVEISVNGSVRQTLTGPPYDWSWSTAGLSNGQHTLRAVASDAAANQGTSQVQVTLTGGASDTQPPVVDLTTPLSGATLFGTVELRATATDDFTVALVEFFADGFKIGESSSAPYLASWDTTTASLGVHRLSVRATDASGNTGTDDDTSVTVERLVIGEGFVETFSGPMYAPDRPGWALGGWMADPADHTAQANSGSLLTSVIADHDSVEARAAVPVMVPPGETELSLWRKVALRPTSTAATASFRVLVISDGRETVVHESSTSTASVIEADWTEVTADLAAFSGREVVLAIEIAAADAVGPFTDARAWLDDLRLREPTAPQAPGDTTPPVVRMTSPEAGATVSGLITVTVEATDETAMAQVLLFLGDELIASDYRAPFEFLWDTSIFPEGIQTLAARAFDRAGNFANTNLEITITRATEPEQEPEPVTPIPAGRKYWGCTTTAPTDAGVTLVLLLGLALAARVRR